VKAEGNLLDREDKDSPSSVIQVSCLSLGHGFDELMIGNQEHIPFAWFFLQERHLLPSVASS
jgi:hypothetical protein